MHAVVTASLAAEVEGRRRGARRTTDAAPTFVFSDVEGSTRLLRQLGEKRYGEAIATHDRMLREAFGRGGGREGDSQGDSFFFVFEDARQAVAAAVDAQRALAGAVWPEGARVKVRIGLHTGKASLFEGKLVGLAVHRAARIGDAGHGGQILLSESTASIVHDEAAFRLRDLGQHRLKDLERPLHLFQLVADGLDADFPPLRTLSPGTSVALTGRPVGAFRFVGRERELGILRHALEDVLLGAGRIATLQGEAGIGKSRLALELGHVATERGVTMVWGTCVEGGEAPTLWPWQEIVRALVAWPGDEQRDVVSPALAGLLSLPSRELPASVPGVSAPASMSNADERFALYTAVVELLRSRASRQPLLVVLDDIHWADTPTLELLQTLALDVASVPLFVVATYREHEPGTAPALARALVTIGRYPWTRRVLLRGLAEDAVGQVIRDTAKVDPPPALVAIVHSRTQGNPLFVAELVRLLAAESALGLERVLSTGIPVGVSDAVRRRLHALPLQTQHLLQLAAVMGNAFDFRLLAQASGLPTRECAEILERALATQIVIEAEEDDFCFSHGLVRETIVDELTPLRRARLHASVADALVARTPVADDVAEIAADHFWRARHLVEPARVVAALEAAESVALRRYAYDAAERLLERGLACAKHLPARGRDEMELRLELELAAVRMMTQGWAAPAVLGGFERAARIARRSGNLRVLVQSLHGTASGLAISGRFCDSLTAARACLAAATELGDSQALALGHHVVGIGHMHVGEIADARREFRACIDAGERPRGDTNEAFAIAVPAALAGLVFAAIAEELGGERESADRLAQRAITAADDLGTPYAHEVATFFAAWLAALEDDPEACRASVERGREAVGEHSFPVFATASQALSSWAAGRLGDDGAVERLAAILGQLEAIGMRALSHFFHGLHADLAASRGEIQAALTAFERAIAVSDASGERFYLAELRRRRGELLVRLGSEEEGRAELAAAVTLAREQGAGGLERRALETLSALN